MRVYASVSLSALSHNLNVARQSAPSSRLMAIVKKNAYGHGLIRIAKACEHKVDGFGVASIEEAIQLRNASVSKPVCVLSGFHVKHQRELLQAHSLEAVVHCEQQLKILESINTGQLSIWVKLDTGMNRLGFSVHDFDEVRNKIQNIPGLSIRGVMTHFACADDLHSNFTDKQIDLFTQATSSWRGECSAANSAGVLKWPKSRMDWIRPGLMLYGVSPFFDISAQQLNIQPVLELYSTIIAVKTVNPGQAVGYGATWKTTTKTRIGIVACGYGDGYLRSASNQAQVLIGQQRANVVGRISMDTFAIDLSDIPKATVGTAVKLFGTGLPVEEFAATVDTLPYEVLSRLNSQTVSMIEN